MKLINHNKNNTYDIDTYVMRGTIKMTPKEYAKAILYLQHEYLKAKKNIDTYKRDSLAVSMATHREKYMQNIDFFCLGIEATRLIIKQYQLKGYKDQNYGIKII